MKKKIRAFLSARVIVPLYVALLIVAGVAWLSESRQDAAEAKDRNESIAEENGDYQAVEQQLNSSGVTLPSVTALPTTTTTIPPDTTSAPTTGVATTTSTPTTTTTIPSFTINREDLALNKQMGLVGIPSIGIDMMNLNRAAEADVGYQALKGGSAAWFASSFTWDNTEERPNDLCLPGEGCSVAIGAHRGGYARTGPFANIDKLNEGDLVSVATFQTDEAGKAIEGTGRSYTYQITVPCHEVDGIPPASCSHQPTEMLSSFVDYESDVETLFLFSCDGNERVGDVRIYVTAELVEWTELDV